MVHTNEQTVNRVTSPLRIDFAHERTEGKLLSTTLFKPVEKLLIKEWCSVAIEQIMSSREIKFCGKILLKQIYPRYLGSKVVS